MGHFNIIVRKGNFTSFSTTGGEIQRYFVSVKRNGRNN